MGFWRSVKRWLHAQPVLAVDSFLVDGRVRSAYCYAWRWPDGLVEVVEVGEVDMLQEGIPVREFWSRKPLVGMQEGLQDLYSKMWALKFDQDLFDALGKE